MMLGPGVELSPARPLEQVRGSQAEGSLHALLALNAGFCGPFAFRTPCMLCIGGGGGGVSYCLPLTASSFGVLWQCACVGIRAMPYGDSGTGLAAWGSVGGGDCGYSRDQINLLCLLFPGGVSV